MKTQNKFKQSYLAAALIVIPGVAFAGMSIGDLAGKQEAEIRASLEQAGYKVHEIEFEDGEIEAEVTLDGKEYEIEIAADTGAIIEIELEDDDDDDNDDD